MKLQVADNNWVRIVIEHNEVSYDLIFACRVRIGDYSKITRCLQCDRIDEIWFRIATFVAQPY